VPPALLAEDRLDPVSSPVPVQGPPTGPPNRSLSSGSPQARASTIRARLPGLPQAASGRSSTKDFAVCSRCQCLPLSTRDMCRSNNRRPDIPRPWPLSPVRALQVMHATRRAGRRLHRHSISRRDCQVGFDVRAPAKSCARRCQNGAHWKAPPFERRALEGPAFSIPETRIRMAPQQGRTRRWPRCGRTLRPSQGCDEP
jgi:hypothetical protein